MERSPIDHDVRPAAQPAASAHASSWSSPESQPALLNLMQDLLGTQADPDPLFFVETWTHGIVSATESFHTRHHTASHHDSNPTAFRAFDFRVPLIIVQDGSQDIDAFPSPSAGFPAAWKNAYGFSRPACTPVSHNDTPCPPASGQPLTSEDACRLLGVDPTSTRRQIRTAFRQLVRLYHPDRLEHSSDEERRIATERMTSINEAYRLLCTDN